MSVCDVAMQIEIENEMKKSENLVKTTEETYPYVLINDRPIGITKSWLSNRLASEYKASEQVIRAMIPSVKFASGISHVCLDEEALKRMVFFKGETNTRSADVININRQLIEHFYITARSVRQSQHSVTFELEGQMGEIFLDLSFYGNKIVHYWKEGDGNLIGDAKQSSLATLLKEHTVTQIFINPRNATIHGFIIKVTENEGN